MRKWLIFLINDYAICFPHSTNCEIPPVKLHELVNYKQHKKSANAVSLFLDSLSSLLSLKCLFIWPGTGKCKNYLF